MPANVITVANALAFIDAKFASPDRSRMLALLLEHQTLDTWMTYQLMNEAIRWVEMNHWNATEWKFDGESHTRDQQSSTSATMLNLKGKAVDSFFNFQSIRVGGGGAPGMRHQNRPDGMFLLQVKTESASWQDMVLFYEGDVHGKDDGKSLTSGCKNSHKMYQAIAQAQSRNVNMAGCVIFAAMKDAPTDNLMPFLDDMLKAHIFVCIAIADWNSYTHTDRKKQTLISALFSHALNAKVQYDFVFGINIGLEEGVASFNQVEYDHRITEMMKAMRHPNGTTIELTRNLKGVAHFVSRSANIHGVKIVVCAIPRQAKEILQAAIRKPMFIYPLHIAEIVQFTGDRSVLDANVADRLLDISANLQAASYNFQKNMMQMSVVYTNNIPIPSTEKNSCLLRDTTGFFYVALPLAYYTIQQFEFVNAALNYLWSPTRHDFRAMLRTFKANKKKLTGVVDVTMFVKEKSSLFQVICTSVAEELPPISKDFEMFLKECCRWQETLGAPKGSSPTVFFRTLGIYSLQNAIDFACDIGANPNKTYTSLLASYPAGAQLLIQQCMKKLSGNEAYAYIGRSDAVPDLKTAPTNEQEDSDDETANKESFVDTLLRVEANIHKALFHSTWKVSFPAADVPPNVADQVAVQTIPPTADEIARQQAAAAKVARAYEISQQLLLAYQKSVNMWTFEALSSNNRDGVQAGEELSRILIRRVQPLQLMRDQKQIKFHVPAKLYIKDKKYRITCFPQDEQLEMDYLCHAHFPQTLDFSTTKAIGETRGAKYFATWEIRGESLKIMFELDSINVTQGFKQAVVAAAEKYSKRYMNWLLRKEDEDSSWMTEMTDEKDRMYKESEARDNEARSDQASEARDSQPMSDDDEEVRRDFGNAEDGGVPV